jgi:signal transduction histidine kinase
MQIAEQVFLVLFGMMALGLLFSFSPLFNTQNSTSLNGYWVLSIGLYAGGFFIFALVPSAHPALLTPANICILGTNIFSGLLFRSWRQPIERSLLIAAWGVLLFLGITYETIRQHGGFGDRVVFVTTAFAICLAWQGYEVARLIHANGPVILKFIFGLILITLLLTLTRTFTTLNLNLSHVINIFNEELLSRFLRWGAQGTMLLTFFGVGTFYLQRQMSERQQMIGALSSKDSALSSEIEEKNQVQQLLVERDELIQSLISAKKSAEVGALSAALAHELNQPLCAIQLNAECLQMELSSVATNPLIKQELVTRILGDNQRASEIITALRQIFSNTTVVPQRVDLVEVMSSLEKLFLPLAKKENITIRRNYPITGGHHVLVNPQEFQQVLLNILNNAVQALSGITDRERRIEIGISKTGNRAYLSVADNGKGIDPATQATIFNLLSSTKYAGMGLGLWLSQHIIERHKGRLYIAAQPGWATTFMIELPLNE